MAFSDQGSSSDFKQYINLSEAAWQNIDYDRFRFCHENNVQIPLSTFLNHIIKIFRLSADASIAIRVESYKRELRELLLTANLTGQGQKTVLASIEKLASQKAFELQKKAESYPKGSGQRFRLNAENYALLTGTDSFSSCEEDRYYSSIGKYLKALFEEYALKTHLERESIYFHEFLETFRQAKELGKAVKVLHKQDYLFEYRVYDIMCDQNSTYYYLVGYSSPLTDKSNTDVFGRQVQMHNGPSSMRISNIKSVSMMKSRSGKLTVAQKKELETRLKTNGPAFITEEPRKILVYLNDSGISSYNYLVANRPDYVKIIDEHYYLFNCTMRHVKYYFISFGSNAKILYPEQLRDDFASSYQDAFSLYQDEVSLAPELLAELED